MTTISIDELERRLREVLEQVQAGEHILIARDGKPVAEISPCLAPWKARVQRAFPGVQWPTRSHKDLSDVVPVRLPPGVDAVAMLLEDREERDSLS